VPKLYEYLGLILFFYSNEHEPIHVHATKDGREGKAELLLENGRVVGIRFSAVTGKRPLRAADLKKFKRLTQKLADEIVQAWVNYFVYHRPIVAKKITGRL
jgi:hypothetical protein